MALRSSLPNRLAMCSDARPAPLTERLRGSSETATKTACETKWNKSKTAVKRCRFTAAFAPEKSFIFRENLIKFFWDVILRPILVSVFGLLPFDSEGEVFASCNPLKHAVRAWQPPRQAVPDSDLDCVNLCPAEYLRQGVGWIRDALASSDKPI